MAPLTHLPELTWSWDHRTVFLAPSSPSGDIYWPPGVGGHSVGGKDDSQVDKTRLFLVGDMPQGTMTPRAVQHVGG